MRSADLKPLKAFAVKKFRRGFIKTMPALYKNKKGPYLVPFVKLKTPKENQFN